MRTRIALVVALAFLFVGYPRAQGIGTQQSITTLDSGTACSNTLTCASFALATQTVVALDVQGTWTGTLTAEASSNGAPFRAVLLTNTADGTTTSGVTVNGTYTVANAGFTAIRLRATAAMTGTAIVGAAQGYFSAKILSPTDTNVTVTGQFFGPTTCTTPAHSFTGRTTTGVCSSAANTVDLATSSTSRLSVSTTGITSTLPILYPDGTAALPPVTFASQTNKGIFSPGPNFLGFSGSSATQFVMGGNAFIARSDGAYQWASGTDPFNNAFDTQLTRSSAGVVQVNNNVIVGSASAAGAQYRSVQALMPVCYVNCGTAPSVAGTDSDMIVTMGVSGVPASLWQVGFRGAWASKPSCTGTMALGTMAIGKFPMVIVTTTGGLTVTTNGTSPATSDVYNIHCAGTQ